MKRARAEALPPPCAPSQKEKTMTPEELWLDILKRTLAAGHSVSLAVRLYEYALVRWVERK